MAMLQWCGTRALLLLHAQKHFWATVLVSACRYLQNTRRSGFLGHTQPCDCMAPMSAINTFHTTPGLFRNISTSRVLLFYSERGHSYQLMDIHERRVQRSRRERGL